MKLAVLTDKPDTRIDEFVREADVLVTLGDLYPTDLPDVAIPHFYVYGNHDSPAYPFEPRDGRHNLHLSTVTVDGVTFGGHEGSMRYKPHGHFLYDDREVAENLRDFPAVDVFIAHSPCTPLGIDDGVHEGFAAFDRYIERTEPSLFLCGHVHRDQEYTLGRTQCRSVYGAALIELRDPS